MKCCQGDSFFKGWWHLVAYIDHYTLLVNNKKDGTLSSYLPGRNGSTWYYFLPGSSGPGFGQVLITTDL